MYVKLQLSDYENVRKKEPTELNVNHLAGVFNILLIGCAASSFIFVLEIIGFRILARYYNAKYHWLN